MTSSQPSLPRRDAVRRLAGGAVAAAGLSWFPPGGLSLLDGAARAAEGTSRDDAAAGMVPAALKAGTLHDLAFDERGRLRLAKTDAGYTRQGTFESAVTDLGETPPKKVSLDWLAQWTVPQTWTKHADNPVYGPKQSGSWDNWTTLSVPVTLTAGLHTVVVWCTGGTGAINVDSLTVGP